MEKTDGAKDKYFIVKNRLDKCVAALTKAKDKKEYETAHVSYGWHIVNAAMSCIPAPIRKQLGISEEEHPECPVYIMFREENHALSPINCYSILNGKKEPGKIIGAFGVL
jgi:hypothetical protein